MKEFVIQNGRRKYKFICEKCNVIYFRRIDSAKKNDCLCINCTRKESAPKVHGDWGSKLYMHWANMKNRCYGEATQKSRDYKERGITVFEEWNHNYIIFKKWALENGYREGLTLDRKNNDGNYEPNNCRWITNHEQQYNKREITKANTSGIKNIYFCKRTKKWRVSIVRYNLKIDKYFKLLEDAIKCKEDFLKANI